MSSIIVLRRPTARVLLLDSQDRLLLMRGRASTGPQARWVWWTVGGGARAGESLTETALREIREEAGFDHVDLGPVVWRREAVLVLADGLPWRLEESYFVGRCAGGEPDRSGWDAAEQELCSDIRWWRFEELIDATEPIYPERLLELLPDILAGSFPKEPIDISVAA